MHCLERSLYRTLWRFARTGQLCRRTSGHSPARILIGVRQMPQSRHSLTVVLAAPFPG